MLLRWTPHAYFTSTKPLEKNHPNLLNQIHEIKHSQTSFSTEIFMKGKIEWRVEASLLLDPFFSKALEMEKTQNF